MNEINKPDAPSCARNRDVILAVLEQHLTETATVLEVGSGTGQHAVYFAEHLPHLTWQTSDREENLAGIQLWLDEANLDNLPAPMLLDIHDYHWPVAQVDSVFTANTLHIMAWPLVQKLMAGVSSTLKADGQFIVYGPFNYDGKFTSDSNAKFNDWLKQQDPLSAIRDIEAVVECADAVGLELIDDIDMPANNRILLFRKVAV